MHNGCSLCGRLVLGLTGQDWCVLPWMLQDGSPVRPGPCHVRCLQEHGLAGRWATAVEAYHLTRWPVWESGRAGPVRWRLHGSTAARRFHLWRSDGRLASFPYAAVRRDPPLVLADVAEVGSAHGAELLAAMGRGSGALVPLSGVLDALGVADRYPLRAGVVLVRRTAPDVVAVRHPLPLDAACRRAALTLTRRTA